MDQSVFQLTRIYQSFLICIIIAEKKYSKNLVDFQMLLVWSNQPIC